MSGIFVVVKDEKGVLHEVAGDAPHVTFVYTGGAVSKKSLQLLASRVLDDVVFSEMVLDRAEISSFEKDGAMRHDVLLLVRAPALVDAWREKIRRVFGPDLWQKCYVREPHVTAAACDTAEDAAARLAEFKALLPLRVRCVGVTVD